MDSWPHSRGARQCDVMLTFGTGEAGYYMHWHYRRIPLYCELTRVDFHFMLLTKSVSLLDGGGGGGNILLLVSLMSVFMCTCTNL